jgi:hypothetical protein
MSREAREALCSATVVENGGWIVTEGVVWVEVALRLYTLYTFSTTAFDQGPSARPGRHGTSFI